MYLGHALGPDAQLRLLEPRHAGELHHLVRANIAHLGQWLPWAHDGYKPEDAQRFIRDGLYRLAENSGIVLGVFADGQMAGVIDLHPIRWAERHTSIGYWLGRQFTGRGLMTRAAHAITGYALRDLGLHRLDIRCAPGNTASCAIPERLGYTFEATLRDVQRLNDGTWTDHRVYTMLAHEWNG